MEFQDLNDEVIADDWLIPAEEISRKKLIRRTPRHNIYKADWFGEVIVYEPIGRSSSSTWEKSLDLKGSSLRFNQEELNSKLNFFTIQCNERTMNQKQQQHLSTCLFDGTEQQTDSAYSSISSSPQYDTKNTRCEFEFPIYASLNDCSSSLEAKLNIDSIENDENNNFISKKVKSDNNTSVILNKDSFIFNQYKNFIHKNEENNCQDISLTETKTASNSPDWFELNELRLVAHESFMLFMGASIVEKTIACDGQSLKEQSTSLVMQMNHPKAISLYNLLHANKSNATPIIDR